MPISYPSVYRGVPEGERKKSQELGEAMERNNELRKERLERSLGMNACLARGVLLRKAGDVACHPNLKGDTELHLLIQRTARPTAFGGNWGAER